jgi:hypothetical protein
MMAKDTDPFELNAAAKQAMEQAHQAIDTYFDFLKKSVRPSVRPSFLRAGRT